MKTLFALLTAALVLLPSHADAQAPRQNPSIAVEGKKISISYTGPSVKGRKVFSAEGPIVHDANYPVWRAGADSSTTLHTEADLTIGGLSVPKGDYSLYVNLKDANQWELIINKQTGQWGLTYDASKDLGRVKMKMMKPSAPVEVLKYTLAPNKITLEWENHSASVDMTAK